MHFNCFYGTSIFGFVGIIVIILYYLLIVCIKNKTFYHLKISQIILSIYLIFILLFAASANINISLANVGWYFPVTICIISEILVYIIKQQINRNKKDTNYKQSLSKNNNKKYAIKT